MNKITSNVQPIIWKEDPSKEAKILVLDQRLLPYEKRYLEIKNYKEAIKAIKEMVVRGAPLIGITAAYGISLAAIEYKGDKKKIFEIAEEIKEARPTAINLHWAINLILKEINNEITEEKIINSIVQKAKWIHEDDSIRCHKMGEFGAKHIEKIFNTSKNPKSILTICNTGALATGGIGTAFGVILTLHNLDKEISFYAAETRPRQQGAKLTTFEFAENNVDCTLVPDTACGYLMNKRLIGTIITGADRIASNGDSANKIGTYQLAVLAKENKIPFFVAAPLSTFDLSISSGKEIPIEERSEEEVTHINGKRICAENIKTVNPAFDVTPAKYITGIITEKGVLEENYNTSIKNAFKENAFA